MNKLLLVVALLCSFVSVQAKYILLTDSLVDSAIYPSTVHHFQVSVPDSYTGTTPAALYLGLDGILCDAPRVFDSLMQSGEMPVTIGVYLQPGVVKDSSGNVLRYNRCKEFDSIDDTFARFLDTELLPYIARMTTPDGRPLRLTEDASQRSIFGLSSGGIAAFTAAWHRPDLFSKVFSGCGTFVPMRGGNELQAIVRKHEPKPIRVFLQDGFEDTWNPLFGSWYEANRMLASALEFSGYDCAFDWAEGGHSVRRATEIFPDVMRWIWRQDSVQRPTANNLLKPLLESGGSWQLLATVPDSIVFSGPRAIYPDDTMIAEYSPETEQLNQCLVDDGGNPYASEAFYWLHSYGTHGCRVSSLAFDYEGNLWALTDAGIQICDQNGRVRGLLAIPSDAVNGLMSIADGMVYLKTQSGKHYSRRLNVKPPVPGQRPESQGQG